MFDYSRNEASFRPHDLVWIDARALAGPAPGWATDVIAAGAPAVLRRARRSGKRLPVGVRGSTRGARHGDWIDVGAVRGTRSPEAIAAGKAWQDHPRRRDVAAIASLDNVAETLDAVGHCWGVIGAVGYELATGQAATHSDSDLDLLLRAPARLARDEARTLQAALLSMTVRCDVQIETPAGGIALADWASIAKQVLVKSDAGPFLTADPWDAAVPANLFDCAESAGTTG